MRQEEIKIPLYGGEMVMVQCENWETLKLVYKSDLEKYSNQPDEQHDGYVFEAALPGGGCQYVVAFKCVPKGSVIAHECVHLVNAVYANCLIPLDIYNDEHQAYLLEWFFDQIDTFFNCYKEVRSEHQPLLELPKNRDTTFTLKLGKQSWPLKLFTRAKGIRTGDKRPNIVVIDCYEIADSSKLQQIIEYLHTIKSMMQ